MIASEKLEILETEKVNPKTENIDTLSALEIAKIMNQEDKKVPLYVEKSLNEIANLAELISQKVKYGGRCIYVGAGTSGRLGVIDAAETIPTFNLPPGVFVAVIAGGKEAMEKPIEEIEDNEEEGRKQIRELNVEEKDVVIGISASGRTPFVIGALSEAKKRGAKTGCIVNTSHSRIAGMVDIPIEVVTGPEVIMGSTRLKAGTAQKIVLNMLSTISMIRMGKVYKNLMVDVTPINEKLVDRAERIITLATGVSRDKARELLKASNMEPKVAIVMALTEKDYDQAKRLLELHDGKVREVLKYTYKEVE